MYFFLSHCLSALADRLGIVFETIMENENCIGIIIVLKEFYPLETV